jgi:FKBP-type peptidyl-prolyl cis-trans isomerase
MRFLTLGLALTLAATACKAKEQPADESANAASSAAAEAPAAAGSGASPDQGHLVQGQPAPADVAAPPADAQKTPSGFASKVLKPGTGTDHPRLQDQVKVHYTGWTTKGEMFDSSVRPGGEPAQFRVGGVIPGWTEGLQLMVVGEKRRFWIPSNLAYGDHPPGSAPAGALTFDVELIDLVKTPDPPPVPEDVKAPPKNAKKTASGLAYRVLKPGTGPSPKATDAVLVHYTGWTTEGKMFDSSVMRGQPITFRLDQVIKGWTEGVQLMKVGEKTRFWIPGPLAYGDHPMRPGAPAGMLVFDVDLLGIQGAPAPAASPGASASAAAAKAPPAPSASAK